MRIVLDEEPYETDAASVGEAIVEAAAEVRARGRVIVEVIVDGTSWEERELESAALAGAAEEVHLSSADLAALACRTLADASSALVDADVAQREAAELLQSDRRAEAWERLGTALTIWQSVHEAVVKAAEALELDLEALRVGDAPFAEHLRRLGEQLRGLRGALRGEDPVGLADALLYEMPEVVAEWREALQTMQSHVLGDATSVPHAPPAEEGGERS